MRWTPSRGTAARSSLSIFPETTPAKALGRRGPPPQARRLAPLRRAARRAGARRHDLDRARLVPRGRDGEAHPDRARGPGPLPGQAQREELPRDGGFARGPQDAVIRRLRGPAWPPRSPPSLLAVGPLCGGLTALAVSWRASRRPNWERDDPRRPLRWNCPRDLCRALSSTASSGASGIRPRLARDVRERPHRQECRPSPPPSSRSQRPPRSSSSGARWSP